MSTGFVAASFAVLFLRVGNLSEGLWDRIFFGAGGVVFLCWSFAEWFV